MSTPYLKIIVPLASLLVVAVVVYLAVPIQAPSPQPQHQPEACIPPPNPFFASSANIEVALTETIKVLKAQAAPRVLDVIPQEARTLEMIGFLTCKAKAQNLIKTAPELLEYTKLLGDIQAGKSLAPRVRHFGSLANLERQLRTTPADNFSLVLSDQTGLLARLSVEELHARDWPSWFKEFCVRYSGCLTCSPEANAISTRVTVTVAGKLEEQQGGESTRCGKI